MSLPQTLYHATAAANAEGIQERGLAAGSYLSDCPEIAAYYAECIEDEGEPAIIVEVDGPAMLAALGDDAFEPDGPSIAEPITRALGKSEEAIIHAWAAAEGTWRDSLSIVRSLQVMRTIPPEALTVPAPAMVP